MSKPNKRIHFIPEIRAVLRQKLGEQGMSAAIVDDALEQWDRGLDPRSPQERGCFGAFSYMQKQIESVG